MNMKIHMGRFMTFGILVTLGVSSQAVMAQDVAPERQENVIEIAPLFEYPVAPEELPGLQEKSNWLMEHFWDKFNFKSKKPVDQIALDDAFKVYCVPMQWAERDVSLGALKKLIDKLSKNLVLTYQFTKAAEENIYGPSSEMFIDEVYLMFLDNMLRNKKIDKARKVRYEAQWKALAGSMAGKAAPEFDFYDPAGEKKHYFPMSTVSVMVFGDPDCDDCRMGKLKMQSSVAFSRLVENGKVNVLFIVPGEADEIAGLGNDFPSSWTVGASAEADSVYDIRITPTVYVIGADGKVDSKNIPIWQAMKRAIELVGNQ